MSRRLLLALTHPTVAPLLAGAVALSVAYAWGMFWWLSLMVISVAHDRAPPLTALFALTAWAFFGHTILTYWLEPIRVWRRAQFAARFDAALRETE